MIHYIQEHQTKAAFTAIGTYAAGKGAGFLHNIQNIHIPPVIIEGFQVLAYAGSFTVAVLTVVSWIQKRFKK